MAGTVGVAGKRGTNKNGAWGGARRGAGRPKKERRAGEPIPHRARAPHKKDEPVLISLRTRPDVPSLRNEASFRLIRNAFLEQRKEREGDARFQVLHFCVHSDRVELIAEANSKRGLSGGITGLTVRIARALNAAHGSSGKLWAERYASRELRTPAEAKRAVESVLASASPLARRKNDIGWAVVSPRTSLLPKTNERRH